MLKLIHDHTQSTPANFANQGELGKWQYLENHVVANNANQDDNHKATSMTTSPQLMEGKS
jgi:hypothetical protein